MQGDPAVLFAIQAYALLLAHSDALRNGHDKQERQHKVLALEKFQLIHHASLKIVP